MFLLNGMYFFSAIIIPNYHKSFHDFLLVISLFKAFRCKYTCKMDHSGNKRSSLIVSSMVKMRSEMVYNLIY